MPELNINLNNSIDLSAPEGTIKPLDGSALLDKNNGIYKYGALKNLEVTIIDHKNSGSRIWSDDGGLLETVDNGDGTSNIVYDGMPSGRITNLGIVENQTLSGTIDSILTDNGTYIGCVLSNNVITSTEYKSGQAIGSKSLTILGIEGYLDKIVSISFMRKDSILFTDDLEFAIRIGSSVYVVSEATPTITVDNSISVSNAIGDVPIQAMDIIFGYLVVMGSTPTGFRISSYDLLKADWKFFDGTGSGLGPYADQLLPTPDSNRIFYSGTLAGYQSPINNKKYIVFGAGSTGATESNILFSWAKEDNFIFPNSQDKIAPAQVRSGGDFYLEKLYTWANTRPWQTSASRREPVLLAIFSPIPVFNLDGTPRVPDDSSCLVLIKTSTSNFIEIQPGINLAIYPPLAPIDTTHRISAINMAPSGELLLCYYSGEAISYNGSMPEEIELRTVPIIPSYGPLKFVDVCKGNKFYYAINDNALSVQISDLSDREKLGWGYFVVDQPISHIAAGNGILVMLGSRSINFAKILVMTEQDLGIIGEGENLTDKVSSTIKKYDYQFRTSYLSLSDITFYNGLFYMTVWTEKKDPFYVATSTNGVNWTRKIIPLPASISTANAAYIRGDKIIVKKTAMGTRIYVFFSMVLGSGRDTNLTGYAFSDNGGGTWTSVALSQTYASYRNFEATTLKSNFTNKIQEYIILSNSGNQNDLVAIDPGYASPDLQTGIFPMGTDYNIANSAMASDPYGTLYIPYLKGGAGNYTSGFFSDNYMSSPATFGGWKATQVAGPASNNITFNKAKWAGDFIFLLPSNFVNRNSPACVIIQPINYDFSYYHRLVQPLTLTSLRKRIFGMPNGSVHTIDREGNWDQFKNIRPVHGTTTDDPEVAIIPTTFLDNVLISSPADVKMEIPPFLVRDRINTYVLIPNGTGVESFSQAVVQDSIANWRFSSGGGNGAGAYYQDPLKNNTKIIGAAQFGGTFDESKISNPTVVFGGGSSYIITATDRILATGYRDSVTNGIVSNLFRGIEDSSYLYAFRYNTSNYLIGGVNNSESRQLIFDQFNKIVYQLKGRYALAQTENGKTRHIITDAPTALEDYDLTKSIGLVGYIDFENDFSYSIRPALVAATAKKILDYQIGYGYVDFAYNTDKFNQIAGYYGPPPIASGNDLASQIVRGIGSNTLVTGHGKLTNGPGNQTDVGYEIRINWIRAGGIGVQAYLSIALLDGISDDAVGVLITPVGDFSEGYPPQVVKDKFILYKSGNDFKFISIGEIINNRLQQISPELYKINTISPFNLYSTRTKQLELGSLDYNGKFFIDNYDINDLSGKTTQVVTVIKNNYSDSVDTGPKSIQKEAVDLNNIRVFGARLPAVTSLYNNYSTTVYHNGNYLGEILSNDIKIINKDPPAPIYVPAKGQPLPIGIKYQAGTAEIGSTTSFLIEDYDGQVTGNDFDGMYQAFQLFGQTYFFDGNVIYLANLVDGVINQLLKICSAIGMNFLTVTPNEAIFFSNFDRSTYNFTGGRTLSRQIGMPQLAPITGGKWSTYQNNLAILAGDQLIYIRDGIMTALELKSAIDYKTSETKLGLVVFNDKTSIRHSYFETPESSPIPLMLSTGFMGMADGTKIVANYWDLKIKNEEKDQLVVQFNTIGRDQDAFYDKKDSIIVKKSDYDALGHAILRITPITKPVLGSKLSLKIDKRSYIINLSLNYTNQAGQAVVAKNKVV